MPSVIPGNADFDSTNRVASGNGISGACPERSRRNAAGNVTSDSVSDPPHIHTYTYDAENRVTSIDSGAWAYAYDSFGRRIERTDSSGNHYDALYDLAGHLETEYTNGSWDRTEIYAGNMHLATYRSGTNQTYFHHTDWLGSERATTDSSGASKSTCSNLPFGDAQACSPNQIANALFTGDEHDSESNTEHTLFRQMSGTQGRWLSPDPLGGDISDPQSLNRYAYAENDPIDMTDPLGLASSMPFGQRPGACGTIEGIPVSCSFFASVQASGSSVTIFCPHGCDGVHVVANVNGVFNLQPAWVHYSYSGPNNYTEQGNFNFGTMLAYSWVQVAGPTDSVSTSSGSWWGTFGKSLLTSWGTDHTGKQICAAVFVKETLNQLNPFQPSASTFVEPGMQAAAGIQMLRAGRYAATQTNVLGEAGLLYPLKSSVFRGMISKAEAVGSKSAGALGTLDFAMGAALFTEVRMASKGQCGVGY